MDQLRIPAFNLTNSFPHPTEKGYVVFYFNKLEEADFFEQELTKEKVYFERGLQDENNKSVHLFGVKSFEEEKVDRINYITKGTFRKPLIHDKGVRYFVVGFGIAAVILALLGAIFSKG